jgi:hypothetical protein
MGQEIDGEVLGDEYKGYIFRITGGNDKQGFPMKQGVLVNGRVRLLLKKSKLFLSIRASLLYLQLLKLLKMSVCWCVRASLSVASFSVSIN